jgi:glycosyltransferase involved in cell wall biosynthesis
VRPNVEIEPHMSQSADTIIDNRERLRIAFVLARTSPTPIGALKIVYQHANGLVRRGHAVNLFHPQDPVRHHDAPPARCVTASTPSGADPHPWYQLDGRVGSVVLHDLAEHRLDGEYDAVVAASWHVVPQVETYSARLGRKVLFLQDYEEYLRPDRTARRPMADTMRVGWPIIAGAVPVRDLVEEVTGKVCMTVACAVDGKLFAIDVPIEAESRNWIGFAARGEWSKRTEDAVSAAELLRDEMQGRLKAWCFGSYAAASVPSWIERHPLPDDVQLRRLYNRTAVFIVPSAYEGFGLPGAEAMACGAALVSTRNVGVDAYAVHGLNAILCPVNDPEALAAAAGRLLDDRGLRQKLAAAGASVAARRSCDTATAEFEACLRQIVAAR